MQPLYLSIDIPKELYTSGMFSVFCYVAGALFEYEQSSLYSGVEIDFKDQGRYYDPKHGHNWWQYFCEPLCLGNKYNAIIKTHTKEEYFRFTDLTEFRLPRHQVHHIIQKYIIINTDIQKKILNYKDQYFKASHIIGVHYRGTDKIIEADLLPYYEVIEHIRTYISTNNLKDFQIFTASDEWPFIRLMQKTFGPSVITYSSRHSDGTKPLHELYSNNYFHAEEAFIDSLLLSATDILFRTTSNLSLWSTFFNPDLKVITLSERF